jgi:hypothetical protein
LRPLVAFGLMFSVLLVPLSEASDPQAPAAVHAYRLPNGEVVIAWTPTFTAVSYIVYRATSNGYEQIYHGTTPSATDRGAPPGPVSYLVSAVTMDGHQHSRTVNTQGGDCVGVSTTPSFYYSVSNCKDLVPLP